MATTSRLAWPTLHLLPANPQLPPGPQDWPHPGPGGRGLAEQNGLQTLGTEDRLLKQLPTPPCAPAESLRSTEESVCTAPGPHGLAYVGHVSRTWGPSSLTATWGTSRLTSGSQPLQAATS